MPWTTYVCGRCGEDFVSDRDPIEDKLAAEREYERNYKEKFPETKEDQEATTMIVCNECYDILIEAHREKQREERNKPQAGSPPLAS